MRMWTLDISPCRNQENLQTDDETGPGRVDHSAEFLIVEYRLDCRWVVGCMVTSEPHNASIAPVEECK